jgi:uncharacterized membrane protein (UPF0127 family)
VELKDSQNRTLANKVWLANDPWSRLKGLLGRQGFPNEDAMWITPCNSIHTFFMKFAIDAVFVDNNLKICKIVKDIKPGRLIWPVWSAQSVFEFSAGFAERHGLKEGDRFHVDS